MRSRFWFQSTRIIIISYYHLRSQTGFILIGVKLDPSPGQAGFGVVTKPYVFTLSGMSFQRFTPDQRLLNKGLLGLRIERARVEGLLPSLTHEYQMSGD